MSIFKLEDTFYFDFTTHNPATGQVSDADSTPTCKVFENDNDTAIISPTVTKRTGETGNYRVTIVATTANGFEIGKSYNVVISATVGSINAKGVISSFIIDGKRINDLNDISQTDILADSIPFSGSYIDDLITSRATQSTVENILNESYYITSSLNNSSNSINNIQTDISYVSSSVYNISNSNLEISSSIININSSSFASASVDYLTYIHGTGSYTVDTGSIAEGIWNSNITSYSVASSIGDAINSMLGLSQNNFRISGQTYDANDRLLSATASIYQSSADALNDVSSYKRYFMSSSYDGSGRLSSYVMVEI